MPRRLLAECLATFFMVFAGTGAIIINDTAGGVIGHPGIAAVFGLVVMVMIYAFGDISGAHMNPAVTLGLACARRFVWREVAPYIAAQLVGALGASYLLSRLFPSHQHLGATLPAYSAGQSFVLELILTAALMLVILRVTSGAKEKGFTAAIAIGGTVGLEALFAGPISGASMNPARSLAPALVSGHTADLWLYPTATIFGALAAVLLHHFLTPPTAPATTL